MKQMAGSPVGCDQALNRGDVIPRWGSRRSWGWTKTCVHAPCLALCESYVCAFPTNHPSVPNTPTPSNRWKICGTLCIFQLPLKRFEFCPLNWAQRSSWTKSTGSICLEKQWKWREKRKTIAPFLAERFPKALQSSLLPTRSSLPGFSQTRRTFTDSSSPLPRHLNVSKGRRETRSAEWK